MSNRLIYIAFSGELGWLLAESMFQNVPALPQDFRPAADAKGDIDGQLALGLDLTNTRADKGRAR